MVLVLNPDFERQLRRWAQDAYPEARRGLLLGRDSNGIVHVKEVSAADAVAQGDGLDADALRRAEAHARERHLEVVGVWVTHPDQPARPAEAERARAREGWSHLIVAVDASGVQELRSWRLVERDFIEEVVRP